MTVCESCRFFEPVATGAPLRGPADAGRSATPTGGLAIIRFFISGIPKAMSVGKGIRVPNKGGGFRQFQTRRSTEWAVLVGELGRAHAPARPSEVGVALTLCFYVPRPTTAARRVKLPLKRPDVDNLVHKLTDSWNGVFWRDDSQVVDLVVRKRFASDGRTGVEVLIEPVFEDLKPVQSELASHVAEGR